MDVYLYSIGKLYSALKCALGAVGFKCTLGSVHTFLFYTFLRVSFLLQCILPLRKTILILYWNTDRFEVLCFKTFFLYIGNGCLLMWIFLSYRISSLCVGIMLFCTPLVWNSFPLFRSNRLCFGYPSVLELFFALYWNMTCFMVPP